MDYEKLIQQLYHFKDKAWCTHTHYKAESIWRTIAKDIPNPYANRIQTEWGHCQRGHGYSQARMALAHEINECVLYLDLIRRRSRQ